MSSELNSLFTLRIVCTHTTRLDFCKTSQTAVLIAAVSLLQTACIRMAQVLDGPGKLGWVLLKAVFRFVFMFLNNCVAIPSYCLYLLLLQPLRIWDSSTFWHVEGIMFKWLLAMVSSWGWISGYTGKTANDSDTLQLFHVFNV